MRCPLRGGKEAMSSQESLHQHIIARSCADSWELARAEWGLESIYYTDKPMSCPCGQFPIMEVCVIRNRKTGNTAEVGNVCVNNFLKLPSEGLFRSVRYVREDASRSFSEEMIEYAHEQRIITDWEYKFYMNIRKKRALTGKQADKKEQVNTKILRGIAR
jgi:hypothetical protein